MSKKKLHILALEDSDRDFQLLLAELHKSNISHNLTRVTTKEDFVRELDNNPPDVILSDYSLRDMDGVTALLLAQQVHPLVPFIIVAGAVGEETAVEVIKRGAWDYIPKQSLQRIGSVINASLALRREKEKNEELQKTLHKLSSAVGMADDSIVITDINGTIEYVNAAFERRTGYSYFEAVGKTPGILNSGHHPKEFFLGLWTTILGGKPFHAEFLNRKKNGEEYYQEETITPIFDSHGVVTNFVSAGRDVTDRRVSEELLKTSERRYRRLFEDAVLGIFQSTIDGKVIDVNPAFARMFGYESPAEVKARVKDIGTDIFADPRRRLEIIRQIETTPHLQSFENIYKRKDGSTFTGMLHLRQINDAAGKLLHIEGMIEDITERKRSEDALRESEFWIRESQRVGRIGSYVTDFVGGYWKSSEVLDEIFGIDKNYVRSVEGWLHLIHPDHHEEMNEYLKEIVAQKRAFDKDYRIVRVCDGRERWVSGRGELMFDDQGRLLKMIGTIQDITERKQTEEWLRQEKDFSENLIQTANVLFLQLDHVGRILRMNKAAEEITGYSGKDVEGKNWFEAIVPRERYPFVWEEFLRISKQGEVSKVFESPILTKNGTERQILWKNSVLKEGDKVTGTISFGMDISERKRSEQAVKESAESFASLFNSSVDGIIIHENGRILDINRSILRLSGYEYPELVGKDVVDLVAEESRSRITRYLSEKYKKPFDAFGKRKDGTSIPIELTTTGISFQGRDVRLTGVRDISERKRVEEALRESEDRFRTIYETSPVGIANVDQNGSFVRANTALQKIFGYSEQELQKMTFNDITYPEDKEIGAKELAGFLSGRKDQAEIEKRYLHKNGSVIWAHLTISTVRDDEDNLLYTVTIVEDITGRRNAEERQRILEAQLAQAQKMEAIGTLAGGIAHDFNNILGIILGHLSILQRPEFEASLRANSYETITKAVQRGASLVRQILTFARKTKVSAEHVNATLVANELAKMLRETFPKTIDIYVDADPSLPMIVVDQTQFHQVLLNLCINARDAMMDLEGTTLGRGKLNIQLSRVSGPKLRSKFLDADASEYVSVAVSDTGSGFDETTKQKIFEPFFTTKGIGKGTGLGLAVVYGVVKSHLGFVDVESTVGLGTRFTLYFPAAPSHVSANRAMTLADASSLKGTESILVVEDEVGLLTLMRITLESNGYKVFTAIDGFDALDQFEKHRKEIALVLTDMGLPKLDGAEMFAALKTRDPNVKVILASGYLEPAYRKDLLRAGAKEFVQKPYVPEEVLQKIRTILDQE